MRLGFGCFRELPFKLFIVTTSTHTLDYAMAGFVLTYLQPVSFYFFLVGRSSQPTFRWLFLLTKAAAKNGAAKDQGVRDFNL